MFLKQITGFVLWLLCVALNATVSADGRMESDPILGGEVYVLEVGNKSKPTLVLDALLPRPTADSRFKMPAKGVGDGYWVSATGLEITNLATE